MLKPTKKLVSYIAALGVIIYVSACSEEATLINSDQPTVNDPSVESNFISSEEAINAGSNFLNALLGRSASRSEAKDHYSIQPLEEYRAYIVEDKNNNGFVILSSSRNIEPVLAYGTENITGADLRKNEALCFWLEETVKSLNDSIYTSEETATNQLKWSNLLGVKKTKHSKSALSRTKDCYVDYEIAAEQARYEWESKGWQYYRPEEYYGVISPELSNDLQQLSELNPDPLTGQSLYDYAYIVTWSENFNSGIGPLISTKWAQYFPYNCSLVDKYDNVQALGCATVALDRL